MKYGVLGFSYAGFKHFEYSLSSVGYYSSNLGDNAQTIASRQAWRSVGVRDEDILLIDRDTLPKYSGEPVALIMNGVFILESLPAPASVTPIFLGFCADEPVVAAHADWLRLHAPIGCRDFKTAENCRAQGIEAFVTGCATLTLPPRNSNPQHDRLFVVLGWPHLLPSTIYKHIPSRLLDSAEFIQHRHMEGTFPLSYEQQLFNEALERHLLRRYQEEASIVLTPLLHVAAPCVAMKVPVILCRVDRDSRFGLLEEMVPLYTPDRFHEINWTPGAPGSSEIGLNYLSRLARWCKQGSIVA